MAAAAGTTDLWNLVRRDRFFTEHDEFSAVTAREQIDSARFATLYVHRRASESPAKLGFVFAEVPPSVDGVALKVCTADQIDRVWHTYMPSTDWAKLILKPQPHSLGWESTTLLRCCFRWRPCSRRMSSTGEAKYAMTSFLKQYCARQHLAAHDAQRDGLA